MANAYTHPTLTYNLGFMIGSTNIPDPTKFSGKESDLDTLGERDMNGYLHRDMVATKHPISVEYENIPWGAIRAIGSLIEEQFSFTYPCPFSSTGTRTITAYAGDREFGAVHMPTDGEWIGSLKFSIIEY